MHWVSSDPANGDPAVDDRALYRLTDGVLLHYAVLAAYRMGLFAALAGGPAPAGLLAARLGVDEAAVFGMAGAAAAFGFARASAAGFELTPSGRAFLLAEGPHYAGPLLDFCLGLVRDRFRYDELERSLRSPPAATEDAWLPDDGEPDLVPRFVAAMHQHSRVAAEIWPRRIALAENRRLLDIGGGSGVHAVAAVTAHPHLHAIVLELPAVAAVTRELLAAQGVGDRVVAVGGSMWSDDFPQADVHFYSDVLHDWPPERCRLLLGRSFAALPAGGRVLIHEMLVNEDRCGPPEVVASGLAMRLLNGGQQFTRGDLFELLAGAGFVDLEAMATVGGWYLVSGRRGGAGGS